MRDFLREYFQFTENRQPEGWLSWQHLLYSTLMVGLTVFLGIFLGRRRKDADRDTKIKVLKIAAIVMVSLELFKIILISVRRQDPMAFRSMLPLFLCSIILISLPIAAFCKGRLQEAAIDFTFCFGFICCIAGSYLAANYFDGNPVLSFSPMVSVTTHCISGFASVYMLSAGIMSMKKENIPISCLILLGFEVLSLVVDILQKNSPYENNYMFLMRDAGTPFSICLTIVGGNQVLYTIFVALIYFAYLALFYFGYYTVVNLKAKNKR